MKKNGLFKRTYSLFVISSASLILNCTANVPGAENNSIQVNQNILVNPGTNSNHEPADGRPSDLKKPGKTLFAIYMIGSDLEDDVIKQKGVPDEKQLVTLSPYGEGSDDLREMIRAYTKLSETEKANLDVIVAFGGARKQGWQGIKYADMNCIVKDGQDNYFGNDDCYAKNIPGASMGDTNTFKDFLVYIKAKYQGESKTILDLWDHGGAYLGSGPDSNTDQRLTLPMMRDALASTGVKWDMIGFDECLMASLEVAKAVKSFSSYMIGSEELEPGHGWNYTDVFSFIAVNPDASIINIGKKMVDSFIDSPDHKDTNGRTLSLIDLDKTDNVISGLDILVTSLDSNLDASFGPVLQSNQSSQHYGKQSKDDVETSIDLVHFANQIKNNKPDISSQSDKLITALKSFIIYSRDDGTKPDSNGISIFSLNNIGIWQQNIYTDAVAVSSAWASFVNRFMKKGSSDLQPPKVSDLGKCRNASENGECLDISDNTGLKKVASIRSSKVADNKFLRLGSEEIRKTAANSYFMPEWDGSLLNLCDGNCREDNSLIIPAEFDESTSDGKRVYLAEARLNDEEVIFYIELNKQNQVTDHWIVPYIISKDGISEISKEQYKLVKGDKIKFYYNLLDVEKGSNSWELGKELQINNFPGWGYFDPKLESFYFADAEDLKGNSQNSDILPEK